MNEEKFFKLGEMPPEARESHNLTVSKQFPIGAAIRAGDLMLRITSVNDSKDTVTFKLEGVFLKPKTEADGEIDSIDKMPEPIILTPSRRIIEP